MTSIGWKAINIKLVNMLRLKGIRKSFGKTEVLKGVDFEVKKGTVVGLLGPNGAGKTTLMRVIVGFYRPWGGEIFWNNELVDTSDKEYRANIGYLPENNPLYIDMTVREYLEMVAKLKSRTGKKIEEEVSKMIEECGLREFEGAIIETLSKGYRQRVGLAGSLLGDPKLLILDEPTAGLDPNQIIEIRQLIKRLAKKKAVVLSTHILPEAKEICDELWIINRGEIVLHQKTSSIRNLEKKFLGLTS